MLHDAGMPLGNSVRPWLTYGILLTNILGRGWSWRLTRVSWIWSRRRLRHA